MIRIIAFFSTFVGTGLIGLSFIYSGYFWPIFLLVGIMIFWSFTLFFDWVWVNSLCLLLVFGSIALGFLLGCSPIYLFAGAFLSFAGWDLTEFNKRIREAHISGESNNLVRFHFLYLCLVLIISLGFVLIAINLQTRISFFWITLLTLAATFGLGKLISYVVRTK